MSNVESFSEYFLEKLGEKYWVVTLIPSVMLVITSFLVFDPIIKSSSIFAGTSATWTEKLAQLALVMAVPSLLVGFVLYVAQRYIVKLFEGYVFFHSIPFMMRRMIDSHNRKANDLLVRINVLKKRIKALEDIKEKDDKTTLQLDKLKRLYYATAAEYGQSYPRYPDAILPTALGNILRASEEYSGIRYGMDAVIWWPRLYNLLPQETKQSIEESVNELHVSLNISVLSVCFYFQCVAAIFFGFLSVPPGIAGQTVFLNVIGSSLRYLTAGAISITVSFFFTVCHYSAPLPLGSNFEVPLTCIDSYCWTH